MDGASAKHRLPVNPRRHKVAPDKRKRVTTACNSCNVRRVKCSGQQPCNACAASQRECVYPAVVEKVSIEKAEFDAMRRRIELYEKVLQEVQPDAARRSELLHQVAASSSSPGSTTGHNASPPPQPQPQQQQQQQANPQAIPAVIDERDAQEARAKLLYDADGTQRYVGETSGAAFMDRIKELIASVVPLPSQSQAAQSSSANPSDGSKFLSSLGEFHTFTTISKINHNVNPLILPAEENLRQMLRETRHVLQDGNGSWPSGGICWYGFIDEMPRLPRSAHVIAGCDDLEAYSELALTQATLAMHLFSCCEWPIGENNIDRRPGEVYYARAEALLQHPLDGRNCSLRAISTMALMATYLLEETKRDAAYMHIAAAVHMCVILGIHRAFRDESTRRVFWTVYCLDRWIGCVLGRPPMISDDAIQLGEPEDAPGLPPAAGLRAHVELSRISGHVVCNMYRIAPFDGKARSELAQNPAKVLWMLDEFKRKLPPTLQLNIEGTSNDPGTLMTHMRANQLLIIAVRPLFLLAVKKVLAQRMMLTEITTDLDRRLGPLHLCIEAARQNFFHARQLSLLRRYPRPSHQTLHFVFTATTCLILQDLVYDRQQQTAEEIARREDDIELGIMMLQQDENCRLVPVNNGCVETLTDLAAVVARLMTPPPKPPSPRDRALRLDPSLASLSLDNSYGPPSSSVPDGAAYGKIAKWMDVDWLTENNYVEH